MGAAWFVRIQAQPNLVIILMFLYCSVFLFIIIVKYVFFFAYIDLIGGN
jgi:hypothetical protein